MPSLTEMRAAATLPVMGIGLTASMGGFLFGSDTGQVSGYIIMPDFLERFAEQRANGEYEWSTVRVGLIVGMLSIGCLLGSLLSGPLGDRFGRRTAIMILCCIFYVGNTVFISSQHAWYQIIIARVISGLAVGGCSSLVPVYVSETVPKEVRGALVATYQLFVTLGLLTSYIVNMGTSNANGAAQWRAAIGIGYTWGVVLGIGMFFLPESPRWLLSKDRVEDTLEALRFVNARDEARVESEYAEMCEILEASRVAGEGQASWAASFSPRNRSLYRTLLGFALQTCQQLTGANYFFYYGATIFRSVGIENSFVTQIILGAVNVICTFPGLYFIERFGRRKPLIYGGLWQMTWLIVFGAVGSERDPTEKSIGGVMILAACMFIASFASTWGPGVWVAIGEMYPLRIRSSSASIATTGNWGWNFLLTFFTPFITKAIQYRYGYVFAGCNAMAVAIVYLFYYESAGLTLEQVDHMYNDPSVKPWKSSTWCPPGVEKRGGATARSTDSISRANSLGTQTPTPSPTTTAKTSLSEEKTSGQIV